MFHDIIEGYSTPENETAQAHKDEWVTKLPRVLSMQLNRLRFEEGNAVKVLTPFKIENTIYPDRFMIQNHVESEKIRA